MGGEVWGTVKDEGGITQGVAPGGNPRENMVRHQRVKMIQSIQLEFTEGGMIEELT